MILIPHGVLLTCDAHYKFALSRWWDGGNGGKISFRDFHILLFGCLKCARNESCESQFSAMAMTRS